MCAVVIVNRKAAIRMNLGRPGDVTAIDPLPEEFQFGGATVVYRNSIFVCGIGNKCEDIWRLDSTTSKWSKCASMIQGREDHSVAFVDHVLYICGGWSNFHVKALHDVETYDISFDKCSKVGKLVYAVHNSGNCVSDKASLYIFGGYVTHNKKVNTVQVYDTKLNTCTLLTQQMPRACAWLCGELWENSVILLGYDGCFIYDIDTQIWKERDKFKSESYYSSVIVNEDKLFVIGCGTKDDDVRWIPVENILNDKLIEWRQYAKLPNNYFHPTFALGKLEYPV